MPIKEDFIILMPLYEDMELTDELSNWVKARTQGMISGTSVPAKTKGRFDCFCPQCHEQSTFISTETKSIVNYSYSNNRRMIKNEIFFFSYACARDERHKIEIIIKIIDKKIIKIGQIPSLADLQVKFSEKISKALGKQIVSEYGRAIGLASHGIGIGSFVYLRRIIEQLIYFAYQKALEKGSVNQEKYMKAKKIQDKIKILRKELPDILVKNTSLYSILSKGIHELTEEDCLRYYQVVKLAIDLIIEKYAASIEQEQILKNMEKEINKIHSVLS